MKRLKLSIRIRAIAILMEISARLKIGKFIGIISMKSFTYPLNSLSIPFPKVPPSRKASPIDLIDIAGVLNQII